MEEDNPWFSSAAAKDIPWSHPIMGAPPLDNDGKKEDKTMEWRDCDDDPPEVDGQRVRVLIETEMDMYYLPSCKKFKWLVAKEGVQKPIGWRPLDTLDNYYNRDDDN